MKKMSVGKVVLIEVLIVIVCLIASLLTARGKLSDIIFYIDVPSIILILLFVIPTMLATGLWRDFWKAFSVGKEKYSISQLKRCAEAVAMMQRSVLLGGLFVFFVSLVMVFFYHLGDFGVLIPSLAVVCITGVYTVVLEFLLLPLKANIQIKIADEMEMGNEEE